MVVGILVGIGTVVVLTAIAFLVYYILKKKSNKKEKRVSETVEPLDAVGVSADKTSPKSVKVGEDKADDKDPYSHLRRRFTAVGVLVAALFSILGVKIFSMQVLSGDTYTKQSSANATSTVKTPAPRGNILDADGTVLVKNASSLTVLAEGDVSSNHDTMSRLSVVLGLPYDVVKKRIQDKSSGAQSQRVVASDVTKKQAAFISEHSSAFKGVSIQSRTVRSYPYGALAAHVLGYTGSASEDELGRTDEGRVIESGDVIGKSGVEASYDSVLAGDHGERVVVTDADGNIVHVKSEIQPTKGSDINTTLKAPVQYLADKLLAETIAPDGIIGSGKGSAGAIVVMDVEDGSIIALANYPTYRPGIFTNGISQDTWNTYNTDQSHYPLLNRAIAGTYPAASTYKAFTSLAGMQYNFANSSSQWTCNGTWDGFGSGDWQDCWKKSGHGTLGLREGIVESCDVVFYEIGKSFFENQKTIGDNAMQDVIKKYNFGITTGIDLSGEVEGRVPTPQWKAEYFKDVPTEAQWLGGDSTNMSIGQGYVLITPIQLAVAYGAIATGSLVKPHLLKDVLNDEGKAVITYNKEIIGVPDVNPAQLNFVKDALHGVATENKSVAACFSGTSIDAACKTGTAEVAGKADFSWTAAYAPYNKPKYVVSCIIEEGGGGSEAATPIAAKVLDAAVKSAEGTLPNEVGVVAGSTGQSKEISASGSSRTD